MEIKMRYKIHLEFEQVQKLSLFFDNVLRWYRVMCNFLGYNPGMQWEDILIFWTHIHCCHPNCMDIFVLEDYAMLMLGD